MKKLVSLAGYVGLFLLLAISPAYAMHIMEGFYQLVMQFFGVSFVYLFNYWY